MRFLPAANSIEAVLFDVGGVLLLPDPEAGRKAFLELGYAPTDEQWARAHYTSNLAIDAMEEKIAGDRGTPRCNAC